MGKIVLEIEEFAKTYSEYKIFDQDCIRIGRAYSNDLIINDPFVSASHVSLKFIDGAWVCENEETLNGTFISTPLGGRTKVKIDAACPVASGDTIFLGKSSIHVWGIDHPVAPEQVLDSKSSLIFVPRNTAQSLLLNLVLFYFIYYLYMSQWIWKSNSSIFQVIAETCFLVFCFVIWAAMWALITRFTKRRHLFLDHLIFSFQWAIVSVAISFVLKYIFFFLCDYSFDYVISLMFFGLFSIYILNNHLAIGTNLSHFKRIMTSSLIVFSIILLSVLGYYASYNEFNPEPRHYIRIAPVPKKFIPAISINEEDKLLDLIF